MRKVLLVSLLSSAVFAAEPPVVSNPPVQNNEPVKETPKENVPEIKSALKNLIGEEAAGEVQIQSSPLKGLQEAILDGNIFYLSEDGRYLIRGGDILDLQEKGKNITEERRNGIRVSAMKELKTEDMIIFKPKETK